MRSAAPAVCPALVLFGALLAPEPACAQELGFKAGLTQATITFSPDRDGPPLPDASHLTGFVGGAILFLPTTSRGGWQVEALLHQKGARDLLDVGDKITLIYLDVPLVAHIDLIQVDTRAVYVVAGPSLAINLRATYDAASLLVTDGPQDIPTLDVGFIAGGGVEYHRLIVDARYTWGRTRVLDAVDHPGTFRNRAFSATAGVRVRW